MKTILVDALNTFVDKENGIFREMHSLLDSYPNKKIVVTNANSSEMELFGLQHLPYEVFSMNHEPNKTDPLYFKTLLEKFKLSADQVIYFEHNPEAVQSAESSQIKSYHYDKDSKDLTALKAFIDANL